VPSRWVLNDDIPLAFCASYQHQPWLVLASYLVSGFTGYTAFYLMASVRAAKGGSRRLIWLTIAGLSMGFGICAMHFIAMLAVEIPIPIRLDLPVTAVAVVASGFAFHLVTADTISPIRLGLGGVVLGAGIGLVHYTGMAALHLPAHIYYEPWLFVLLVVVAVLLSTAALFALSVLARVGGKREALARIMGSLVVGLAILLMHYTELFAVFFYLDAVPNKPGGLFDPAIMAAAGAAFSLVLVGLTLAATSFNRRVEQAEMLLRDAVENFSEGFVIYDQTDRLVTCNQAYRKMHTESGDLLVPGALYEEVARRELQLGKYPDALGREAEWLAERMRERREATGSSERQISDGSWMLVTDRRMNNGGTAGLRVDISALKAAQTALHESEQRLDRAQEITGIGSWEFDVRTGRRVWSKELYRIRGVLSDEDAPTVGGLAQFTHPDDCSRLFAWLDALKRGTAQQPIEYRIVRPDGQARVVRAEGRPVTDTTGAVSKVAGTLQDVTERRRIEQQLDMALNNLTQGVCFFDGARRLILANRRYAEIYGLSTDTIRPGTTLEEIVECRVLAGTFPNMDAGEYLTWRASIAISDQPNDTVVELKTGQIISIHHRPMPDGGWVATHEEITERRQTERRLAHMARHDALTGLPNRVVFREYMEQELDRRARSDSLAVLCLDLDHFKYVNDTLGHAAGDALLCAVAERLTKNVRSEDIVVRLGGDEFAIVQIGVDQPGQATALAMRLIEILSQPFALQDHRVAIGTSVGIAFSPANEADADTLLKHADMALYRAKASGRGSFCFFDSAMNSEAQARHTLESGLRMALANGEFELFFQPILHARSEVLIRFEALLRWRHPQRGLIGASEFISLAEEIGVIIPIGEWVLREACHIAATWPDHISVAVNLSSMQLKSANLTEAVSAALQAARLPPSRLELEINETVLLQNTTATLEPLRQLQAGGLRISLDDFGTGYSSISSLRIFPFDKIKIDQSFVRDLDSEKEAAAIVHAIVDLGSALGMLVTAEGVETAEQLRMLRAESCQEVQGYLFSKPVSAAEVPALIERMSSAAGVAAQVGVDVLGASGAA
jgi:diguanylate cyclase (GGDEF)-like protein/PAS domain S-box-containing protein